MPSNIVTQRVDPKTFLACNSLRAWLYVLSYPTCMNPRFERGTPSGARGRKPWLLLALLIQYLARARMTGTHTSSFKLVRTSSHSYTPGPSGRSFRTTSTFQGTSVNTDLIRLVSISSSLVTRDRLRDLHPSLAPRNVHSRPSLPHGTTCRRPLHSKTTTHSYLKLVIHTQIARVHLDKTPYIPTYIPLPPVD